MICRLLIMKGEQMLIKIFRKLLGLNLKRTLSQNVIFLRHLDIGKQQAMVEVKLSPVLVFGFVLAVVSSNVVFGFSLFFYSFLSHSLFFCN